MEACSLQPAPCGQNAGMDMSKREIAAAAARLVVEEGLEYGPAKRRALRDLGLPQRTALPGNDEVEAEVRDYIALYCADTQPGELRALRELALQWMERMAPFRPHVGGAVWHGTATRLSDIYIQLFCDDSKSAEIALIDHHVDYEPRMVTGFARWGAGGGVEQCMPSSRSLGEEIGVHLLVYDLDDLRGALKPDAQGRAPRGDLTAAGGGSWSRKERARDEMPTRIRAGATGSWAVSLCWLRP